MGVIFERAKHVLDAENNRVCLEDEKPIGG
jgi:hypothetical protein